MIVVERTAPLLTVQDRGRTGYFADGVTQSGPLDALALAVGNALVGNALGAAALEGCLGGARFRCEAPCTVALTGADVSATLSGAPLEPYVAATVRPGDVLDVERIVRGAVWYVAVRGGIDVPIVLDSRATLVAAGLGGVNGAPIRAGATLPIGGEPGHATPEGPVPGALRAPLDAATIPLTAAPRSDALTDDMWEAFYRTAFVVSHAVSRVGYRLDGAPLSSSLPADIASEPACLGAMQLPPEGRPIVLMADHPTIGGYPIIGVVPACAIGRLAQRAPGSAVRFAAMEVDHARAARAQQRATLLKWAARD